MKLSVVISKQQALSVLASTIFDLRTAGRISQELAKIEPILKAAQASAMELYKKHGALSADNARYDIPADCKDAFDADVALLNDTEIDLTLSPVNVNDVDKINIAPGHVGHLITLDGFILSGVARFLGVVVQPALTVVGGTDVAVIGEQVAPVAEVAPVVGGEQVAPVAEVAPVVGGEQVAPVAEVAPVVGGEPIPDEPTAA